MSFIVLYIENIIYQEEVRFNHIQNIVIYYISFLGKYNISKKILTKIQHLFEML